MGGWMDDGKCSLANEVSWRKVVMMLTGHQLCLPSLKAMYCSQCNSYQNLKLF